MAGTVHGLDCKLPVIGVQGEHARGKFVGMAGLLPQGNVHYLWGFDLLIAILQLLPAHVTLYHLIDGPSRGVPKHHTRRLLLGVKQIEFLRNFPVIALLGFSNPVQIGF